MSVPLTGLLSRLFRKGPDVDLRAAAGGDGDALTRLYDAHVDGLYAFVFHRVGRDQKCGFRIGHQGISRQKLRQGAMQFPGFDYAGNGQASFAKPTSPWRQRLINADQYDNGQQP